MTLTYPEILQTISTLGGLVGVGVLVYATFIARRVHGAVTEVKQVVNKQTADLKQSIHEQTNELKR